MLGVRHMGRGGWHGRGQRGRGGWQQADLPSAVGERGGGYTVNVPPDWQMFVEPREGTGKTIGRSIRVHYISQDGRYQMLVERFVGFYGSPPHKIADYVLALRTTWPQNDYVESNSGNMANPPGPGGPEAAQ
ncbi:hypothetical protein ACFQ1S_42325, partial [Kibdelosporangium lantanae]